MNHEEVAKRVAKALGDEFGMSAASGALQLGVAQLNCTQSRA